MGWAEFLERKRHRSRGVRAGRCDFLSGTNPKKRGYDPQKLAKLGQKLEFIDEY
jgi:hypothetical protein